MGDLSVNKIDNIEEQSAFVKRLLNDIKALELMLKKDMLEHDIMRIGAEQEFCLVTDQWRPSYIAEDILIEINDPHFTTELARYNLEINLDPVTLGGDCFHKVEKQLNDLLLVAREKAAKHHNKIVLAGILPTISKKELEFEYMTPQPRYWALNDVMKEMRGSDFELHLKGVDELSIRHNTVLFEACNTSFQLHLQIPPDDFISSYNWAQAISAPILGISTNSPLLFGRELWSETRIGLFQQSIDIRNSSYALKDQQARVMLGDQWAEGTVADIFKNDIARHKVIFSNDIKTDSLEEVSQGKVPKLNALNLHNGTIYRWNRPCYGITNGKPHLRIENRYIPSGPSTVDEMANFAFWVGVMNGRPKKYDNIKEHMDFRDAKSNFIKAARNGKESILLWGDQHISTRDLVINELLPIANEGLKQLNIDLKDIERYLKIIEERTESQTGSHWQVMNYRALRDELTQDDALLSLTKSIHKNQLTKLPAHQWPPAESNHGLDESATKIVAHIMSTNLLVVNENDLAELAMSIMKWKKIHHVPVENKQGELVGLLTWSHLLSCEAQITSDPHTTVSDIMTKNVVIATPSTEIRDVIKKMKKNNIGCLPVIQEGTLVGIVTIKDISSFYHGED